MWVVARGMRRPARVLDRWAVIVGFYVAAALVGGLLVFTGLPSDFCLSASVVLCIVAFWCGVLLVPTNGTVFGVIGGLIAAMALAYTLPTGVQTATLALRGSTIDSTVIDVKSMEGKSTWIIYRYKLADPDGHEITGRLTETGGFNDGRRVGDHVLVVADPDGLVDPETPSQVAAARRHWIVCGISFLVTALMALWSARSVPSPSPAPD